MNRNPSGLGLDGLIRTEAAVSPGNSGGPLLDSRGRVIGINTVVLRAPGSEGLGFAIPIRLATDVAEQVLTTGRVSRAFLGISFRDIDPQLAGRFGLPAEQGAAGWYPAGGPGWTIPRSARAATCSGSCGLGGRATWSRSGCSGPRARSRRRCAWPRRPPCSSGAAPGPALSAAYLEGTLRPGVSIPTTLAELRASRAAWAVAAAVMTLLAVFFYANLTSPDEPVEHAVEHRYAVRDPQFARTMSHLLGPAVISGNRITALQNGDQSFPAMLESIRSARRSVNYEGYILWDDTTGRAFADAMSERARAGIPVRLLVDWVGSQKLGDSLEQAMRSAGVRMTWFRPLRWYSLNRVNKRTHRKVLVVDGRVGFTGGLGLAHLFSGHAQDEDHWRDSQYRAEGPVVGQMQATFLDNWIQTGGELLDGPAYFPPLDSVGPQRAQAVHSSPGAGTEKLRLMYLLAVASAARSIRIANSYFVPNTLAVKMLVAARRRGVDVEIIVPGKIGDATVVRRASRAKWGPLLEAGVRIYEYQPTMYHMKVMIVDDYWVSVGSTNLDSRSFRLNDENNLNVFDEAFAREQAAVFAEDRSRAREITLEQWRRRPLRERLAEQLARVMRHQL